MYPLKFKNIVVPKVWGEEQWQLSGYGDSVSVVENGYLAGDDLNDLLETYMDELVGEPIYERFGNTFPLLFKVIDARDDLSIQVHPNDEVAWERHEQLGKAEMWFVLDTDDGASIINGFARDTTRAEFLEKLEALQLPSILQTVNVNYGDVAYIPAGRVHALRRGTVVAEIQQTSDVTYRVYDYHRPDKNGQYRQLHVDEALDVLDFHRTTPPLVPYRLPAMNVPQNLVKDEHFTTNYLRLDRTLQRDYALLDSFVVYMCVWGQLDITALDADEGCQTVHLRKGETVLIPASLCDVQLTPTTSQARVLEVYVET